MDRLEDNLKLLEVLSSLVKQNPHLRFGQILVNFDFFKGLPEETVDMFYAESSNILERVKEGLRKQKGS